MSGEKWLVVGGWGCPKAYLEAIFLKRIGGDHVYYFPGKEACEAIRRGGWSGVFAYSLGAALCMDQWAAWPGCPVYLYAPFCSFLVEGGQGGKVCLGQLRYLKKWVQRDPVAALNDFYQRARLGIKVEEVPYSKEDLVWGLEWMEEVRAPREISGDSRGVRAFIGNEDVLLDAVRVNELLPFVHIVQGAGHGIDELATSSDGTLS